MAENVNFILIACTVCRFTGRKGYKVKLDVVVRRRKSKGPKERYAKERILEWIQGVDEITKKHKIYPKERAAQTRFVARTVEPCAPP
jgi:hypothetical protein